MAKHAHKDIPFPETYIVKSQARPCSPNGRGQCTGSSVHLGSTLNIPKKGLYDVDNGYLPWRRYQSWSKVAMMAPEWDTTKAAGGSVCAPAWTWAGSQYRSLFCHAVLWCFLYFSEHKYPWHSFLASDLILFTTISEIQTYLYWLLISPNWPDGVFTWTFLNYLLFTVCAIF